MKRNKYQLTKDRKEGKDRMASPRRRSPPRVWKEGFFFIARYDAIPFSFRQRKTYLGCPYDPLKDEILKVTKPVSLKLIQKNPTFGDRYIYFGKKKKNYKKENPIEKVPLRTLWFNLRKKKKMLKNSKQRKKKV